MRRRVFLAGAALAAMVRPRRARGEGDALDVIVPDLPSAAAGTAMRVLEPFLRDAFGRPVVADFRPGAGGMVGLMAGAEATADGRTLTVLTPAITLAPWLSRRMDCVPADFAPLGRISFAPSLLYVAAASVWRGVADLLAAARTSKVLAVPGPWDWQPSQLAQALFLMRTRLPHLDVPPTSAADRLGLVARGDADFAFATHQEASGAGAALRPIAVAAPFRIAELPEVPTLAEDSIALSSGAWHMLAVPAATPDRVVMRLGDGLREAMAAPAAQSALRAAGIAAAWLPAAEAARIVANEYRAAEALFSSLGLNVRLARAGG